MANRKSRSASLPTAANAAVTTPITKENDRQSKRNKRHIKLSNIDYDFNDDGCRHSPTQQERNIKQKTEAEHFHESGTAGS